MDQKQWNLWEQSIGHKNGLLSTIKQMKFSSNWRFLQSATNKWVFFIAQNVMRDNRNQSYVAIDPPRLQHIFHYERVSSSIWFLCLFGFWLYLVRFFFFLIIFGEMLWLGSVFWFYCVFHQTLKVKNSICIGLIFLINIEIPDNKKKWSKITFFFIILDYNGPTQ